jgi:HAMP domain-containing protein
VASPAARLRAVLGRMPLRLRVALAFALTTAVALVGLGVFVQLRVADTLEERLDETLEDQLEQLETDPPERRASSVERLAGEVFAQLLDADGGVLVSSARVRGPLVDAGDLPGGDDERSFEQVVDLVDEDELEREPARLLVRRVGDQVIVVGTSREDTDEALEEVRSQLLIGGPVALGLAAVLGYAVAGAGLRPIERMRRRAATISDRSSGERLPLPAARDELHRLGATLNEMLDRLEAALERERRFVAEASHELRTPLALMRMELDLALSRPRSTEELTAALHSANEESG